MLAISTIYSATIAVVCTPQCKWYYSYSPLSLYLSPAMSASDPSLRIRPSLLDLTVSTGSNLNQPMKSLLDMYTKVLATAIEEQHPTFQIEELKVCLLHQSFLLCSQNVYQMKMLRVATKNGVTVHSSEFMLPDMVHV